MRHAVRDAGFHHRRDRVPSGHNDDRAGVRDPARLASLEAIADAGLSPTDIDGVIVYGPSGVVAEDFVTNFGIPDLRFSATTPMGGASAVAAVQCARRSVITESGTDPQVVGLVYIAAFAPDKGESVNSLIKDPPPDAPVPPILPPRDGYLFLDKSKFRASFAGDVEAEKAAFMADSQVPWGVEALSGEISEPAWKSKPSWYLLTTEDRMIPPPAQRFMSQRAGSTVVPVAGRHAIYVSQPNAVVALIKQAAQGAASATAAS